MYDRLTSIIETISTIRSVIEIVTNPQTIIANLNELRNSADHDFMRILGRQVIEDGLSTLVSNGPRILGEILRRKDTMEFLAKKNLKGFLIYMPTPYAVGGPSFNLKLGAAKILGEPVFLKFGGSGGGRFTGFGVQTKSESRQLFRMDWHSTIGHGDSADWRDGAWHFHVGGNR